MTKKKTVIKKPRTKPNKLVTSSIEEIAGAKIFELAPEYVEINGWVYERLHKISEGVNLELTFEASLVEQLENEVKNSNGRYFNVQQLVRDKLSRFKSAIENNA